jgi:hypothetical protein
MTTPSRPDPAPATEPAAPPAPALEPAAPLAPPTRGPTIREAGRQAAERFRAGQPITPAEPVPVTPAAPAPEPQPIRARNPDGTFAAPPLPGAPVAPEPGTPAAAVEPAPDEPPAIDGGDGGATDGGEPATEPGLEEGIEVALPGRRPGEVETFVAPDQEAAEALRRLAKGYLRGEEVERHYAELDARQTNLDEVEQLIEVDPVGFVVDRVHPDHRAKIALQLIADPTVWDTVASEVEKLLNPQERRLVQAELKADRLTLRDQLRQSREETQGYRRNVAELRQALFAVVPNTLTNDQVEVFLRDAFSDIRQYADTHNLKKLDPAHLPIVLRERFEAWGVNPVEAARLIASRATRAAGGPPAPRAAAPSQPAPARRVTSADLTRGDQARRAVAAAAPAGAGAPPATIAAAPKGSTIRQATEHLRKIFRKPA